MPQHLVAIDVSRSKARIAVIESSLRAAELTLLETVERQPNEEPAAFWRRLRTHLPSGGDTVIVNVNAQAVSTRLLSFPFADLRKVEAAIDFELENQLPHELSQVATSWVVAPPSGAMTRIVSAAVSRAQVIDTIQMLTAAGMEPRAVVLPAASLGVLLRAPGAEPVAILSVGHEESHLAVVKRNLLAVRTLRAGGKNVDQGLAQQLTLDLEAARRTKETSGQLFVVDPVPAENAASSQAIAESLRPLVRQIMTTLKSLAADDQPKKLYLTGGLSRLSGLDRYLAQQLGLEVELLDVAAAIAPVTTKLTAIAPEYAVAIAMVLTLLRRGGNAPLNFCRGELAFRGDLQVYRGHIVRSAIGLGVLLMIGLIGSIVRYVLISREEMALDAGFCSATKRIVGKEICNPTAALATLKASSGGGEGITMPPYSASRLLEMVSKDVDRSMDVQFDELELRVENKAGEPDRIIGRGQAATFETTDQLVQKLRADPCVQDAEVSKQRKTAGTNRVEFNLAVKINCPAGVLPGEGASIEAKSAAAKAGAKP